MKYALATCLLGLSLLSCRQRTSQLQELVVSPEEKATQVRHALVFEGIEAPAAKTETEVKNGPLPSGAIQGQNYFTWGQELSCLFSSANLEAPPGGLSPKFICDILDSSGQVVAQKVKIKYDARNPELYNELAGSRLFWLLGFPSDHYYSVKINCLGCPDREDPWTLIKRFKVANDIEKSKIRATLDQLLRARKVRTFGIALIEKKWGETIAVENVKETGWSFFDELVIPEDQLLFPIEQRKHELAKREALSILAAMISHVDNQQGNQRIDCRTVQPDRSCRAEDTFLLVHDLGATMGGFRLSWDFRTGITDRAQLAFAMNIWKDPRLTAVFTGPHTCELSVASASAEQTLGPLKKLKVSEAGRRFLMSRLVALGGGSGENLDENIKAKLRQQLQKVFLAGRNGELYQSTDWWVETLMSKIMIVANYKGCQ